MHKAEWKAKKDKEQASHSKLSMDVDAEFIWYTLTTALAIEQKIYIFWHACFQHLCHKTMIRLEKCGVLLKCILKAKKPPLCSTHIFPKQEKRDWRTKGNPNSIRSKNVKLGDKKSCDHVMSS